MALTCSIQGAEPLYLHLIRPIIKPYTRTLDAALELMLMVGDFLIALSIYPVRLAVQWWKMRFAWFLEPSTSVEDSSDESPNEDSTSEVSSSFLASGQHPIPSARGGELRSLRKSSKEIPYENRRPYNSSGTHRERGFTREDLLQEPTMWASGPSVRRQSSSHQSSRSQYLPTADNDNGEIDSPRHQIWYPPSASYPDNGIDAAAVDRTLRPLVSVRVREQVTILAEQQTDEWRQYPPFPSAYPPTPIATTARLVPTSLGIPPSLYPPILEEVNSQQDFHRLPLPPRIPLNPSRAGDLGDYHDYLGIQQFLTSDADDSISTDGYGNEGEDDFNVTLKTPLQLNGSTRSRVRPRLFVSPPPISAVSSNLSVPSRSSALTTMDNGSPFRTDAWSDSSHSSTVFNQLPASVIGKKRSHPRASMGSSDRVEEDRDYDSSDVQHPSSSSHENRPTPYSQPHALERLESVSTSDAADSVDIAHSTSSSEHNFNREQSPPKEKRRKVTTKSLPTRSVHSRPIKNKGISSPPRLRAHIPVNSRQTKRSQGTQLLEVPAPPAKRRSERLKGGGGVEIEGKGRDQNNGVDTDRLTESSAQECATRK